MPADPEQTARLRELHDQYAWKVNAAVAEDRPDLIDRYSAEYVEEAVGILAEGWLDVGPICAREGCEACARPVRTPPPPPGRWRRLLGWFAYP
jgi:hypothetical protein